METFETKQNGSNEPTVKYSPLGAHSRHPRLRTLLFTLLVTLIIITAITLTIIFYPSQKNQIISSENDSRQYRAITLHNSIQVTLIRDVESSSYGCAANVQVGTFSDGPTPGLAHFIEHLLFMGSKRFPDMRYFDEVISGGGGMTSAYTDLEVTNYWFKVSSKLFHATEVLANFFIDGLISEIAIEAEIEAVESKYCVCVAVESEYCLCVHFLTSYNLVLCSFRQSVRSVD